MKKFKTVIYAPPPEPSPTIEKLKEVRKNVPYVVVKYKSGNSTVWERQDKGKLRLVHGGLKNKISEENFVVSTSCAIGADVLYCTKKEVFTLCL